MTARLHIEKTEPHELDLARPIVYRNQVDLARMIARFLEPMPLDELAKIATDAAHMAHMRKVPADALQQMRRDRDTIEVMRSAQKQLRQIAQRYER